MNRYYIACIVTLVLSFPLQAMEMTEKSPITGYIYVAGPVTYGPQSYYKYLNKTGISADDFEPLIQVDVIVNDTDESNNAIESLWTNHESDYVLNDKKQSVRNEKKLPIPHIIKKADNIDDRKGIGLAAIMNRKYFPSHLPVQCFGTITKDNYKLTLSVHTYTVLLRVISNPRCNFINQINDFIKAPRYFKWKTEGFHMTPFRSLIDAGLIKEQERYIEEEDIREVLSLCGHKICPRYCTDDLITYEHGEKGKEVVEQLKVTFAHLLPLTGKVLLWPLQLSGSSLPTSIDSPAPVLVLDVQQEQKSQSHHVPPYPLAVQNFGY